MSPCRIQRIHDAAKATRARRDNLMKSIGDLKDQLAEIGYSARDITYFALSHYHGDHAANANAFAASTWIVRATAPE